MSGNHSTSHLTTFDAPLMAGPWTNDAIAQTKDLREVECPEPVEGFFFVYILLCRDGSFYVGMTQDVKVRLGQHRTTHGAKHTFDRAVQRLVFVEGPLLPGPAARRERQLKGWTRAKKMALIRGDVEALKRLSRPGR
jgi:putative endonuclease